MKKTSRSHSSTRHLVLAMIFIMVVMSLCAVWNTSTFDLWWIFLTFAAAGFITFFVIAPQSLPIENTAEERQGAYGVFGRFLLGQGQAPSRWSVTAGSSPGLPCRPLMKTCSMVSS